MATFSKLDRGTLSDDIVADIRGRIARGELKPGVKLPNELDLAKAYGVGRGTVREAVKALSLMRLLRRSTSGTFVESNAHIHAPDDLLVKMSSDDPDYSSLYETRILLENRVIELACERATESDLASIDDALEREDAAKLRVDGLSADLDYHLALAEAAHSPMLLYLYMVTTDAIARAYQTFANLYDDPKQPNWGPENHRQIATAVRQKDPEKAQRIATESLERAAEWAKKISHGAKKAGKR